jgi:hypothetical protein
MRNEALGFAATSLGNWVEGEPISHNSSTAIFNSLKLFVRRKINEQLEQDSILDLISQFQQLFDRHGDKDLRVYDAGKILTFSVEKTQIIMDNWIYERLPMFPRMLYGKGKTEYIEENFRDYGGIYYSWLRRGNLWLKCPMKVRYKLKIAEGLALRCKLNIPVIDREEGSDRVYWEYDGFLTVKSYRMFWTFEQRLAFNTDYMYFVTDIGQTFQGRLTISGQYLSTGQEESRPVVHGEVFIRKIPFITPEKALTAMHDDAVALAEGPDFDEIEKINRDFRQRVRL